MAGASIIKHKGVDIYYVDYRYQSEEQMIKILDDIMELIIKENTPRPVLINITKTFVLSGFMKETREKSKKHRQLATKVAIVTDMSATRRILLSILNRFVGGDPMWMFDNEEDAKEYLIS